MRRRRLRGERGKAPWLPLVIGKAPAAADQGNRSAARCSVFGRMGRAGRRRRGHGSLARPEIVVYFDRN